MLWPVTKPDEASQAGRRDDSAEDSQRREVEDARAEWTVPVLDAVRRDPDNVLKLIIAVSDTSVVVAPPTSVGYVVPHTSIELLCAALRTADAVAEHRKKILGMDAER